VADEEAMKNLPVKLFLWPMEAPKKDVNLISQREDVRDIRESNLSR